VRQELPNFGFQFLRQVFQLRLQAGAKPLAGPDEFIAEGRQGGAVTLPAFDQRCLKKSRPLLDQIPGVPVGHVRPAGRQGDFTGYSDFVQDIQHGLHRLRVVALGKAPHRVDVNTNQ
jgi:hypothetical protein